jgi:hypothetical protein
MSVDAEVVRGNKGFAHVRMLKRMWLEFILARKVVYPRFFYSWILIAQISLPPV